MTLSNFEKIIQGKYTAFSLMMIWGLLFVFFNEELILKTEVLVKYINFIVNIFPTFEKHALSNVENNIYYFTKMQLSLMPLMFIILSTYSTFQTYLLYINSWNGIKNSYYNEKIFKNKFIYTGWQYYGRIISIFISFFLIFFVDYSNHSILVLKLAFHTKLGITVYAISIVFILSTTIPVLIYETIGRIKYYSTK